MCQNSTDSCKVPRNIDYKTYESYLQLEVLSHGELFREWPLQITGAWRRRGILAVGPSGYTSHLRLEKGRGPSPPELATKSTTPAHIDTS